MYLSTVSKVLRDQNGLKGCSAVVIIKFSKCTIKTLSEILLFEKVINHGFVWVIHEWTKKLRAGEGGGGNG